MRRLYNLWLFCGFGAVMAAFALSTFLQWLSSDVRDETHSLLENALPAAEYLSNARAELRTLETDAIGLVRAGPEEKQVWSDRADESLRRLDDDLEAYASTPFYPGERELYADVQARRGDLRALIDSKRASEVSAGQSQVDVVRGSTSRLDDSLLALTKFNIIHGEYVSRRIGATWRRATVAAFGLDAAAAVIAVGSMLAFRRVLRREIQLAELHQRVTDRRAAELEAFAGRIAHDLRNPLSALAIGVSTVSRQVPPGSDPTKRVLDRMQSGIERTEVLIEGLLAFASSGAAPAPGQKADLARVLGGVLDDIPADAEILAESPRLSPTWVSCSPGALTSILSNLVHNAVKYMRGRPERRLRISVGRREEHVRVEIADTGPGIPPEMEGRVFEPFFRIPGTTEPGLGLGLATVKRVVEGYGGSVGVKHSNNGAAFWFELPTASGPVPEATEQVFSN